jgi:hypothetical protein
MSIPTCLSAAPGILAAELTINGLALCCFNQMDANNKFWEVAYLRHKRHTLSITIEEVVAGGVNRVILPRSTITEPLPSFSISLDVGTNNIYQNFPQGGCRPGNFNRADPARNNPNDLRWMIDFAGADPDHGTVTRLKPRGGGRIEVTLANLHHTLLFTKNPGTLPVRLVPKGSSDPTAQGFELGRINEEIGGLMMAPTGGQIVFTGLNIQPLSFNAQTSYKIEIVNEDFFNAEQWPGPASNLLLTKGDFHLFYEVIDVDGQQKELWAIVPAIRPRTAADGDCNPSSTSSATLQPLIQP